MMRTLGAIGFDQSYTYFAWRTAKEEIEEYLREVSEETAHLMRPAFWPTTHDILTPQMWDGGTAIFAIRAMLAAPGVRPTWGHLLRLRIRGERAARHLPGAQR